MRGEHLVWDVQSERSLEHTCMIHPGKFTECRCVLLAGPGLGDTAVDTAAKSPGDGARAG